MQNMYHSHYLTSLHIAYLLSTPSKIFHSFQMNKSSTHSGVKIAVPTHTHYPRESFQVLIWKKQISPIDQGNKRGKQTNSTYPDAISMFKPRHAVFAWWTLFSVTGPWPGWDWRP